MDPTEVGLDPARIERARDLMRAQVESGRSPGLAAVVARRGQIVLADAFGVRNLEGDPVEIDTIFSRPATNTRAVHSVGTRS